MRSVLTPPRTIVLLSLISLSSAMGGEIHEAAMRGDVDHLAQIIDKGANVNKKSQGGTPLHFAALEKRTAAAELLIDAGADVNAKGYFGRRPLHMAALQGANELAVMLISRGAEVDALDKENATPLAIAVLKGEVALAKVLIENGANVNVRVGPGSSLLHGVTMAEDAASRREMAELLVAHGADVNAVSPREKNTPLAFAAIVGRVEVVAVLVESGADVNVTDAFGRQPLHNAAIQGQPGITELLLAHGATVNAKDDLGLTPLHWAAAKGRLQRSRGHDLAPTLPPGLRPYHMDHAGVVKLLVSNGADGAIEDKEGRTPRDLALQNNNSEIARLLEDGGASGE